MRILDEFLVMPSPQIGMHQAPGDGTRAHQADLNDEIVERPRLEAGKHRHLRAALDLEDADRVTLCNHGKSSSILWRNGRKRERHVSMVPEQLKAVIQLRQCT